jgi:uncharacterized membrane-anchored protein
MYIISMNTISQAGQAERSSTRYGIVRTVVAGIVGGLAFVLGVFLTFAQFGGSRSGQTGLLFDPATQSPKVIAVWKEIEPLPRTLETPVVIVGGLVLFGLVYAFVYRSVAPSWPRAIASRAWRLALIVWVSTVFSEFIGPFNVLHHPLELSLVAWGFWAVPALAEGFAIACVFALALPSRQPTRMVPAIGFSGRRDA